MIKLCPPTPILRIFDEEKAREFYVEFLGFSVNWEHRFEDNFPLYMELLRDGCTLHLTEHHGDCSPGAAVRIETQDIDAFHAELSAKDYAYAKPGIEETPWNMKEMTITDPFGNRLVFFANKGS